MGLYELIAKARTMSSGSIIFKSSSSSFEKETSDSIDDTYPNPKQKGNSNGVTTSNTTSKKPNENRLAPFSPTHSTAQSTALDLLQLTHHDVFFDLGCGDGRLVLAALERCYDDDYLMKVHQERFARLLLQKNNLTPPKKEPSPEQQQQQKQVEVKVESPFVMPQIQPQPLKIKTHIRKDSSVSFCVDRTRSLSTDYSLPHLMARDDVSESDTSTYNLDSSIRHGSHGSFGHGRVGSGISGSFASIHSATPASPNTPVVCNRNINKLIIANGGVPNLESTLPPDNEMTDGVGKVMKDFQRLQTPPSIDVDIYDDELIGIPKTIETPSPDGRRGSFHCPQISELPVDYSSLAQDFLATVPSGDIDHEEQNEPDDEPLQQPHDDDDKEEEIVKVVNNGSGAGVELGGLKCVGIEYNQALAEQAQANLRKSYIYPHVENARVCIRWGDVLEEWNRQKVDKGNGNSNVDVKVNDDANNLTLLDDATAVFVYLLPQGLKKVKSLLYEAAVRRNRQRQQQEQRRLQQQKQKEMQLQQTEEAQQQHHPLMQRSLLEGETNITLPTVEGLEASVPLPQQQLNFHRKEFTYMSDITDYDDFRNNSRMDSNSLETFKSSMPRILPGGGEGCTEAPGGGGVVPKNGNGNDDNDTAVSLPPFRVVSYMFSIQGWTPSKVDRSSKGACPLYLYENIHDAKE